MEAGEAEGSSMKGGREDYWGVYREFKQEHIFELTEALELSLYSKMRRATRR